MKYCVSGRQSKGVIKKADQIKMKYNDKDRLIDYVEEFKDKTFILDIPAEVKDIDWNLMRAYAEKVDFMLCIKDLNLAKTCHEQDIKFYWNYPVFTWYELEGLIALEPVYIMLGAPLSFCLDKVKKKTEIPLRLCPNLAYDAYIPRENGIYGAWVRPEDVDTYGKWIDVFEFSIDDLGKEATLLHVYQDNGSWPGNLNLLLTNLNANIDNRALPEDLGKKRATCGQRCVFNGSCHYCESAFARATALKDKHFRDNHLTETQPSD